jgi:3-methyl-2-oxobutanoate hydroxymethyltransferase
MATVAQYLFFKDVLDLILRGRTRPHAWPQAAPRQDLSQFAAECARLQQERIAAYKEFIADANTGRYPAPQHGVPIDDAKFAQFVARIKTQGKG